MKKTYKIDVDCANCANKWKMPPRKTPGVKDATVNFMTLKMIVEFDEARRSKKKLCLVVRVKTGKKAKTPAKFS